MSRKRCWFAALPGAGECDGKLRQCHLIPRRLLVRELGKRAGLKAARDPRSWVWGCGGPMGCSGHHGQLDFSRTLRIPREKLPAEFEAFVAECDDLLWDAVRAQPLGAWLDREYGMVGAA